MTDEHETTTEAPEMAAYRLDTQPLPSPWQSVVYAFRQARLVRLEARVQRLRRQTVETPVMSDQRLLVVAACGGTHAHRSPRVSHRRNDAGVLRLLSQSWSSVASPQVYSLLVAQSLPSPT